MSKKRIGYILLGAGALMTYAQSQVSNPTSGVTLATPIWGELATLNNQPASISPSLPGLGYIALAVGAWLAFF